MEFINNHNSFLARFRLGRDLLVLPLRFSERYYLYKWPSFIVQVPVCVHVCVHWCVCVCLLPIGYHLVMVERLACSNQPHSYVVWSLVLLVGSPLASRYGGGSRQNMAKQLVGWGIYE